MSTRGPVVVASANPHKVAELGALLAGVIELAPRPIGLGAIAEDAATLGENAAHKAIVVARHGGTSALADDTGLEVDALGGAPGVRSARYAAEGASDADNRRLLLANLANLAAATERGARFRTVLAFAEPDGTVHLFEGTCEGTIAAAERGELGFGYDSVFVPREGDGRTLAELSAQEKNSLSHRARAAASLSAWLSRGERG